MKYIHSLQLVISSILVLFITSCEDDKINASDEFSGVSFNEESVDISVPQTGASYTVEVQTTTTYNQDLTFNLDIVEDLSDYGTSDFDMNSQVIVPAGSTVGTSTINFDWDAIAPGVVNTIVLPLTTSGV